MRPEDRARLTQRLPVGSPTSDAHAVKALGIYAPNWETLRQEILADLTAGPPYGIGWWAPHPGTSRRILISDQLYACTCSVLENLAEAALHKLEFLEWADHDSDLHANAVTRADGALVAQLPVPKTAMDVLTPKMTRLHLTGALRALSAALDCLAGTTIGVVALPMSILRADFQKLRRRSGNSDQSHLIQREFAATLEQLIDESGPQGWIEWVLTFRNMLVHRGRRTEMVQLLPRLPVVYGPDGQPVPRMRVVTQLPSDPDRSDIEVLLDASVAPVLTEPAERTLSGVLQSTLNMIERIGERLLHVWRTRRADPETLPQPTEQWRNGVSSRSGGFSGYASGSCPYEPSVLVSDPIAFKRMKAAALDDAARPLWTGFE